MKLIDAPSWHRKVASAARARVGSPLAIDVAFTAKDRASSLSCFQKVTGFHRRLHRLLAAVDYGPIGSKRVKDTVTMLDETLRVELEVRNRRLSMNNQLVVRSEGSATSNDTCSRGMVAEAKVVLAKAATKTLWMIATFMVSRCVRFQNENWSMSSGVFVVLCLSNDPDGHRPHFYTRYAKHQVEGRKVKNFKLWHISCPDTRRVCSS